ncbi:UNVERIFIED_CONTAM: hypothetical protein K2H54_060019 [Gekko kuhli]
MWLVPGAVWKIIFPAVLCLAKAAMELHATAETMSKMTAALPDTMKVNTRIAQALQCINGINSGENAFTIIVITAPKNSTGTMAEENITNFPKTTMPITVFGNTATTDRYSKTVSEPGSTIAGDDPTTNKAVPGVSSTAFEEVTKNFLQNVINTVSVENPYTIYMSTSSPGGATTPNGDATTDTANVIRFLEELPMHQDDVLPAEDPGFTTLLSTEDTTNTVTEKSVTQGWYNAVDIATTFGNAPEDPSDNTQSKW